MPKNCSPIGAPDASPYRTYAAKMAIESGRLTVLIVLRVRIMAVLAWSLGFCDIDVFGDSKFLECDLAPRPKVHFQNVISDDARVPAIPAPVQLPVARPCRFPPR